MKTTKLNKNKVSLKQCKRMVSALNISLDKNQLNILKIAGDTISKNDKFNDPIEVTETDQWNEIEQTLRSNVKHSACSTCWNKEKEDIQSLRQTGLFNLGPIDEIEKDIRFLDLKLGNLCNLKCRMCSPLNSSQLYKEVDNNIDTIADPYTLDAYKKAKKHFQYLLFI